MAHHRTSAWTWVLIAGLLLFGGVYLVLIIGGSGLMPGDVPVDATVNPAETEGGGAPMQDLGAFPWTAVVLIGTAILGIALALSQFRASRVTPEEERVAEAGTRQVYREAERQDQLDKRP